MFGFKVIKLANSKRALIFKNKNLDRILNPGLHIYFDPLGKISVRIYNLTDSKLKNALEKHSCGIISEIINEHPSLNKTNDAGYRGRYGIY